MKLTIKILIILFISSLDAQTSIFNEANCIINSVGKVEKEFIIKTFDSIVYNNSGLNYNKIFISYFGEFYVSRVDDTILSSLGPTNENQVSIWLEDGEKEKMFELRKEKQDLGYPFDGYRAYYSRKTSNGLEIYDVIKTDCALEDKMPYELKSILVLNSTIHQLIFREKISEMCFFTYKK